MRRYLPFVIVTVVGLLAIGGGPSDISLASVGSSGKPDILVTNLVSGDVSVMLNRGDGTFAPEQRFRAGASVRNAGFDPEQLDPNDRDMMSLDRTESLAVGDFNGDGIQDVVTVNANGVVTAEFGDFTTECR